MAHSELLLKSSSILNGTVTCKIVKYLPVFMVIFYLCTYCIDISALTLKKNRGHVWAKSKTISKLCVHYIQSQEAVITFHL